MKYVIGQILGLLPTVCCIIGPFWKKKWQMMVNSAAANLMVALNFLLIGEFGPAVIINLVAVAQTLLAVRHCVKGTQSDKAEKIIFFVLYVGSGLLTYQNPLDLMPVLAAVLFMLSVFQKKEQDVRKFILCNACVWITYGIIVGSTTVVANACGAITTIIALYKYGKEQKTETTSNPI